MSFQFKLSLKGSSFFWPGNVNASEDELICEMSLRPHLVRSDDGFAAVNAPYFQISSLGAS